MSRLLIDEPPLQVLPSLAKAIGLEEAIVLQQIHYRMRVRAADANEWVPISVTTLLEWCPFLSRRSVERIIASLKTQSLIEVAQRSGFDRTNWLRIRYEAIDSINQTVDSIPPNGGIDTANLAGSHTANLAGSLIQESKGKKKKGVTAVAGNGEPEIALHDSLPRDSWREWVEHRKARRWPNDATTLRKQLGLLSRYDQQTQQEIIDTSIQAGWQGLFALKGKPKAMPQNGKINWAEF